MSDQLPAILASDRDRDRTIELLRDRYASGALTLDELTERVERALRTRTRSELDALTTDLRTVPVVPVARPQPRGKEIDTTIAIMSGNVRRGQWRPARQSAAFALMGGIKLDLREADFEPGLEIVAVAVMGGIDVIVPEGVTVELSGTAIMGANEVKTRGATGPPVVFVRAFSLMGGVTVRTKRPAKPRAGAKAHRAAQDARRHARLARAQARRVGRRSGFGLALERAVDGAIRTSMDSVAERLLESSGGHTVRAESRTVRRDDARTGRRDDARTGRRDDAHTTRGEEPPPVLEQTEGTVTILFSDIEGFTQINDRLGDRVAQEIVRAHNRMICEVLDAHGGQYARSTGDGCMALFTGARPALRCALDLQQLVAEYNASHADEPFVVRVGVHTGEVIRRGTEVFGKDVVVAGAVAEEARGAQILASSTCRALTDGSGEFAFDDGRDISVDGLTGTYRAYAVVPATKE